MGVNSSFGVLPETIAKAVPIAFQSAIKFVVVVVFAMSGLIANASASTSDSGYFIEGYDVVSYFIADRPSKGTPEISTEYKGKTLLFSSEENRAAFMANPESYMPAYNGYCAYGMVYGMKSEIDPLEYDIVDGRLYLQLDRGTKRRWNRRINRYITKSDKAWQKLGLAE